jgi:hypothetical protein
MMIIHRDKDGVGYCVINPNLVADLLVLFEGAGIRVAGLSGGALAQLREDMKADIPSGTVQTVPSGGRLFSDFFGDVSSANDGLIMIKSGEEVIFIPTSSLSLLKQIDTCQQSELGGAVVFWEPDEGGFKDPPYLLYGGIAAGALLLGYLAFGR